MGDVSEASSLAGGMSGPWAKIELLEVVVLPKRLTWLYQSARRSTARSFLTASGRAAAARDIVNDNCGKTAPRRCI